jgi:hypothetical protein
LSQLLFAKYGVAYIQIQQRILLIVGVVFLLYLFELCIVVV